MGRRCVEVGWEYEVPADEVEQFRDTRSDELQSYFGTPVRSLSDRDVAKYMVRASHPSSRYLKSGLTDLVFHR